MNIEGTIVDITAGKIYPGIVKVSGGKIVEKVPLEGRVFDHFILPGFVDSHVHIESSMLVPSEFARMAVVHGTVATVSDPHEIANVCGLKGVDYMIENGRTVPFKFNFGAPSCVPATSFETAGAAITVDDVKTLLAKEEISYLAEMMNFPGVLQGDRQVMDKIAAALAAGKPVDGHAPGLRGELARRYIQASGTGTVVISTDHECFTKEEALDKLDAGMNILIREGSAARNFDALIGLLHAYPDRIMFCSDDKHPDSLMLGHINDLCARAVRKGIPLFHVLQAACINPVKHYNLNVGLLRPGDPADFIVVKDLKNFEVLATYIDGGLVAENGQSKITAAKAPVINNFNIGFTRPEDFVVPATGAVEIPVIEALDGQLITNRIMVPPRIKDGCLIADPQNDILKIVVVNRYSAAPPAVAFIKNIGLREGALASSVAHDSHNIVAVGVNDAAICEAVNKIIEVKGGLAAVTGDKSLLIPLPVAGLMSNEDGYALAKAYMAIDQMAKEMGSAMRAPFMTLSFMALLVIPALKLSDKGLFDGENFRFV